MIKIRECREFTDQCRAMAKATANRVRKTQFLRLANQWDGIANTRQKVLTPTRKPDKSSNREP
jgi:hypothetical protein